MFNLEHIRIPSKPPIKNSTCAPHLRTRQSVSPCWLKHSKNWLVAQRPTTVKASLAHVCASIVCAWLFTLPALAQGTAGHSDPNSVTETNAVSNKPKPLLLAITENKLEESVIRVMGQDARLIVRRLRYENGLEIRRLSALYTQQLAFVFFHFFEPKNIKLKMKPGSKEIASVLQTNSSTVATPQESFEPGKRLRIRSLDERTPREWMEFWNGPASALNGQELERRFTQAKPCEPSEILGLAKLRVPAEAAKHSFFALGHQDSLPLFGAQVWVCAQLL